MIKALGVTPSGRDLERVRESPNYRNGNFQNLSPTEVTLKEASFFKMMRNFLYKPESTAPPKTLPSVRTDLRSLKSEKPAIVWFGHSSYFIKYNNVTVLVDPVFSGNASPVSTFAKAFPGSDIYATDDFPEIDILVLTHDHYDHLDYKTIIGLASNVNHFYVSLGVEAHLKYWGIDGNRVTSFDWWQSISTPEGFTLTAVPGRHFSGRTFKRNQSIWSGFVLKMNEYTIYLGGDSGYDTHFKEIGNQFGPFDLVLLESGQYNRLWPYIHLMPEETVTAAKDLQAKLLMPVHWGKFALAFHDWDEPVKRVLAEARKQNQAVTTPMIGQALILGEDYPSDEWWNL